MVSTHIVGNMDALNSFSLRIEDRTYRALVNTRPEISAINCRIYDSFQPRLELQRNVKLRTANEFPLHEVDLSRLQFRIGKP